MKMIKNKYAAFTIYMIVVLAVWNLLDYLYSTFITHSGYRFGAGIDLGLPVVVGGVVGYFLFLRKNDD